IPVAGRFSFDDLLQRIHPAESRVRKLAKEYPATFIAFDIIVGPDGRSLLGKPLRERRRALEQFAAKSFSARERVRLSPATNDLAQAKAWFETVGGNLDGIIAKRSDYDYRSGERTGM